MRACVACAYSHIQFQPLPQMNPENQEALVFQVLPDMATLRDAISTLPPDQQAVYIQEYEDMHKNRDKATVPAALAMLNSNTVVVSAELANVVMTPDRIAKDPAQIWQSHAQPQQSAAAPPPQLPVQSPYFFFDALIYLTLF